MATIYVARTGVVLIDTRPPRKPGVLTYGSDTGHTRTPPTPFYAARGPAGASRAISPRDVPAQNEGEAK